MNSRNHAPSLDYPSDLNTMRSPKCRSNSLFHYKSKANQEYSTRISLNPEGEKNLYLKYQILPGHVSNVFYKTDFIKEKDSLKAFEKAELQSKINKQIKEQKYQILLEKDNKINSIFDKKNNEIKSELDFRKIKLKNKLIQIIRESLIFARNNSPVGAMLQSTVAEFFDQIKAEPDNSLTFSLSYESTKTINEKRLKTENSRKIKKKKKNEFLKSIGVDVENLTVNNINLDIDKALEFISNWGKGRNIEDILRLKVVNSVMSLTEQNAAQKVKYINRKYNKFKEKKMKEKLELLKKKKEEEEKRLEELRQMDPREIIRGRMKESIGQKGILKKGSHSVKISRRKKPKDKIKLTLNGYKDVDKILEIIDKSDKNSRMRFYQDHFNNIRRKKSFDLGKEKAMIRNQITDAK